MGRNEVGIDLVLRGEKQTVRGVDNVSDATRDAGKSFDEMAKEAGHLDKKIGELSKTHKDLIAQFDQTGDADLLKQIRKSKRELRMFEGLRKEHTSDNDIAKAAADVGKKFGTGFVTSAASTISSGGPVLIGGLAAAAVALSPLIGGAVGAGVLGGIGAGGLIGGITAASQDSRVKAAAEDMFAAVTADAMSIGDPFVDPLIDALRSANATTQDLLGDLAPSIGRLADEVEPLVDGVEGMAKELVPGLIAGLDAARPILRVVSDELPELGEALSDAFKLMAEDPDGAALALRDLLRLAGMTIRQFGFVVAVLSGTYESILAVGDAARETVVDVSRFMSPLGPLFADLISDVDGSADAFSHAYRDASSFQKSVDEVAKSAEEAAAEIEGMKQAIDELFGKQMGFDEALGRWHDGLADLRKELAEGKRELGLFTEEGRINRDALLDQVKAAEDLRRATAEQTGDLPAANAEFQKHIEAIYKVGAAAGFSKDELNKLLDPYRQGPIQAIIEFKLPGLLSGVKHLRELIALLTLVPGGGAAGALLGPLAGVSKRAGGGTAYDGQLYVVGEQGPELIRMNGTGHVYPAGQSASMLAGASSGAATAGGRPLVTIMPPAPSGNAALDALVQALWPFILKQVRVDGGDLSAFGASN